MPEMVAPRALVFRPLVKGNEALGTRLGSHERGGHELLSWNDVTDMTIIWRALPHSLRRVVRNRLRSDNLRNARVLMENHQKMGKELQL